MNIKNFIPMKLKLAIKTKQFNDSPTYWETRYAKGGSSSTMENRDEFESIKAQAINNFIKEKNIRFLIDFGCGDGVLLDKLKVDNYWGLDISPTIIFKCKQKFKDDSSKDFRVYTAGSTPDYDAPLVMSNDVIFHLVEDNIFQDYMITLFSMSSKYVMIHSTNKDTKHVAHERHHKFTDHIPDGWKLLDTIPTSRNFNFYIYGK